MCPGDHLGHGLLQLGALLDQVDHPERQEGFREWNGDSDFTGHGGGADVITSEDTIGYHRSGYHR